MGERSIGSCSSEVLYKELQLQMMQALILVVYGKKKGAFICEKMPGGIRGRGDLLASMYSRKVVLY